MITLSPRLQTIADHITPGLVPVDVGCDHGHLPIWLVQSGWSPSVIATDIAPDPLDVARKNVEEAQLFMQVDLRLCDGLQGVKKGDGESLVIAGMGGLTICHILEESMPVVEGFWELILEPQSEYEALRRFLYNHDLLIVEEKMIKEREKYYPIIKALPRARFLDGTVRKIRLHQKIDVVCEKEDLRDVDFRYGPMLLRRRDPLLFEFLKLELNRYKEIFRELRVHASDGDARFGEIRKQLEDVNEGLRIFLGGEIPEKGYDDDM